jgi:hypothetical protein
LHRCLHQRQPLPLRSLSPNGLVMLLGGHPLSVHAFYGVSAEQQPTHSPQFFSMQMPTLFIGVCLLHIGSLG